MVTVYGTRKKQGHTYADVPPKGERTAEEALKSLIKAELNFGGLIKELSETRIVVETSIMGGACIDTTYFEGEAEEMAPLVLIAATYARLSAEKRNETIDKTWAKLEGLGSEVSGSPFFVTHLTPMLMGQSVMRDVLAELTGQVSQESADG